MKIGNMTTESLTNSDPTTQIKHDYRGEAGLVAYVREGGGKSTEPTATVKTTNDQPSGTGHVMRNAPRKPLAAIRSRTNETGLRLMDLEKEHCGREKGRRRPDQGPGFGSRDPGGGRDGRGVGGMAACKDGGGNGERGVGRG